MGVGYHLRFVLMPYPHAIRLHSVRSHNSYSATHTDKLSHYRDEPDRARLQVTKMAGVVGIEPTTE